MNDKSIEKNNELLNQIRSTITPPNDYESLNKTHRNLALNATNSNYVDVLKENLVNRAISMDFNFEKWDEFFSSFPTTLEKMIDTIFVPKKVKRYLEKSVSRKELKKIDPNHKIAIEKLLLIVSNFKTYETSKNQKNRFKKISHQVIQTLARRKRSNTCYSSFAIKLLEKHKIIEVKKNKYGSDDFQAGSHNRSMRLTEEYFNCRYIEYQLQSSQAIENRISSILFMFDAVNFSNPIIQNLFNVYVRISLPTVEEIHVRAKELISGGYQSKGKKLVYLNNRKKDDLKESHRFVEEHIRIYQFLERKIRIPLESKNNPDGRIYCFLAMMPKWIREMVKIDGEEVEECDFKCLHPNLIMNIYEGDSKYITHKKTSELANIELDKVKKEHLSFFNRHENDMMKSPLWEYYNKHEPKMMIKLCNDKKSKSPWYKITSARLLTLEVKLMKKIIAKLNSEEIYVVYVFDALYVKKSVAARVREVMNQTAIEMGIYTTV
jgi:hypothetical protein